jgi:putative membrane protein
MSTAELSQAPAVSAKRYHVALLAVFALVFVWSAIGPHDYFTWFLEVVPAIVALIALLATYRRFQFTPLVYTFILLHSILLMVGGHYTYAEVPLGNWVRDALHLGRNHYDRLGHFAQGFVPALVVREVFIRRKVVKRGWLYFIVFSVCMMVTAVYELFEFAVAKATGTAADAFLGSQGDVWDTQWDMTMCFIGCNVALLLFAWWQDRQIAKFE